MSIYKASIYNYLFNSINAIIVIVNGIVMVPIYFHYMSVSTYGAWLATGNVVGMLGLLESGFSSVITQKMAAAIGSHNMVEYQKLSGSNLLTAICIPIIILLIGLFISPLITQWIHVEPSIVSQIRTAYIIALFSSCIAICVSLICAFPQVWQDTKMLGIISTLTGLLSIALLIVFLLCGLGVVSIALSYLVRSTSNLIFQGTWILKKRKREHIPPPVYSLHNSIILMKDCIYPFLSKISGILMGNSQSFIIAYFMNPGLAAIFDLTAKICSVACGFVSQTNGSFFALFSLTLSTGDQIKINNVFRNTSRFFSLSIVTVALFSICFTEPVIHYWVGLDKYGGTVLLVVVVFSNIFIQIRSYCNNILYTGGMINRSAKFDILCALSYILVLLSVIKSIQIYAIPTSILIVSAVFIALYLKLMNKQLNLDVRQLTVDFIKSIVIIIPFLCIHFVLKMDYHDLFSYTIYFIVFCLLYCIVLYFTHKTFVIQIAHKFLRK